MKLFLGTLAALVLAAAPAYAQIHSDTATGVPVGEPTPSPTLASPPPDESQSIGRMHHVGAVQHRMTVRRYRRMASRHRTVHRRRMAHHHGHMAHHAKH